MSRDPFSDASPWGMYRPRGSGGLWLKVSRMFPGGWPWSRLALVARRLARHRLSGPVDTRLWGLRLRLFPRGSVSEARILFLPRSWDRAERALLKRWVSPGFTFVDVGANAGAYSFWVLSLMRESGRVVAVEPDPALARQLRYNVRVNRAEDRMQVVEAAVGACSAEGTLIVASRNSGENRLAAAGELPAPGERPAARGTDAIPVKVVTLADVVSEAGLDRIDCLKVDVEGREAEVIMPFLSEVPRGRWPRRLIVELKRGGRGCGGRRPRDGSSEVAELEARITASGYRLLRRTKLNGIFEL